METNTTTFQSPQTPSEWQAAVDVAHACLLLESARFYGLVTGGPKVNVGRCEELLELGKGRGFEPADDAVERFLADMRVQRTKGT